MTDTSKLRETPETDEFVPERIQVKENRASMRASDFDALYFLARTLERQRDELVEALKASVGVIKVWHNMGMPESDTETWRIYYDHSPEMKPIREVLAKIEGERK